MEEEEADIHKEGGEQDEKPISDEISELFKISFFRAPWRRRHHKGPAHYCIIGLVCATYLFAVGGYLTYTVFWGDSGTA